MKTALHGRSGPPGDELNDEPNIIRRDPWALTRAQVKKASMDKRKQFLDLSTRHISPAPEFNTTHSDAKFHIADKKVARLLLVLHELDRSVAGLEDIPQSELRDLVSSAILACGFLDGMEARDAIAAVLETIESRDPTPESS
jgi:hypothetical protein